VVYLRGPGDYLPLEGHVRLEILKSMGVKEAQCLLSTDDEAYTITYLLSHSTSLQAAIIAFSDSYASYAEQYRLKRG